MASASLFSLIVAVVICSAVANNTTATVPTGKLPEYSKLSYFTGLVVMIAFVVSPVALMAYRNRNSILEFIKDR